MRDAVFLETTAAPALVEGLPGSVRHETNAVKPITIRLPGVRPVNTRRSWTRWPNGLCRTCPPCVALERALPLVFARVAAPHPSRPYRHHGLLWRFIHDGQARSHETHAGLRCSDQGDLLARGVAEEAADALDAGLHVVP